jgi:dipeptidyl aminopeptidase/acylaminoacyl peptidase
MADATTGQTRTVHTESSETEIDVTPTPFIEAPNARILGDGNEFVWYSTRDGWGHLYLHDGESGDLKCQLTSGPWAVHEIKHLDEEGRWIYFVAGGREEGRDPYLRHLYRVRLDGSDLSLLTEEDADHAITFSPSGQYVVDEYSRVDMVPVTVLRSADGRIIRTLEMGDISQLQSLGWRFPERFSVKARDGVTDLYGVITRPTTFDPAKSYPVIDSIYPGPQIIKTPKRFPAGLDQTGHQRQWVWHDQALAELGFIVITIDGQGTPYRSKAFLDVAYGDKFGEAGGLADHIAGLRQLASREASFDLNRVGIYGHSGGGYASARALMTFPDFYKVAVSSAGNHDQHGYVADWGERYIGLADDNTYRDQANFHLAGNLKGKLLLIFGGLDDNVPPALTSQLIDALMAANKDFDLLALPHCDHSFVDLREGRETYESGLRENPYFVRRLWDYFVRHLLGAEPPQGFSIA